MASVAEHNQLIKVCFDGSKHLNHVMSAEEIKNLAVIEDRYPLTRLPVCGHCERLGLWHHGGQAYCPSCGTYTRRPITYAQYLASGYDVDATGATAKLVLEQERSKRALILPDYGE